MTSLTACWIFSSQKRKALTWSEPKSGLRYVGIIKSLALATHFYNPRAMLCWQTVSLPTLRILFNLPHFLGLFPGGLPPA